MEITHSQNRSVLLLLHKKKNLLRAYFNIGRQISSSLHCGCECLLYVACLCQQIKGNRKKMPFGISMAR